MRVYARNLRRPLFSTSVRDALRRWMGAATQSVAFVRPTAHINSEVQVLAGGKASTPVSEPICVVVRRGGEQGDEHRWPIGVRT